MRTISSPSFSFREANIFISDNGVLVLFCFLETMLVPGHQESDFQSSFYLLECSKDIPQNCSKIITDESQNKLSEPIGLSLLYIQSFLSHEEMDGIDGI